MENYPTLAKEIDFQEGQEAQRVPKLEPTKHTPRHIIIKLPKIEVKERILKAVRNRPWQVWLSELSTGWQTKGLPV